MYLRRDRVMTSLRMISREKPSCRARVGRTDIRSGRCGRDRRAVYAQAARLPSDSANDGRLHRRVSRSGEPDEQASFCASHRELRGSPPAPRGIPNAEVEYGGDPAGRCEATIAARTFAEGSSRRDGVGRTDRDVLERVLSRWSERTGEAVVRGLRTRGRGGRAHRRAVSRDRSDRDFSRTSLQLSCPKGPRGCVVSTGQADGPPRAEERRSSSLIRTAGRQLPTLLTLSLPSQ